MSTLPHALTPHRPPQVGLIVLQADETLEVDLRRLMPPDLEYLVSRIPSGDDVTPETLAAMEGDLARAAGLLPAGARFAALAYCCTSGTAQIGAGRVADLLAAAAHTAAVTDPVTALIAACRHLGVARLTLLSPYMPIVSDRLCATLAKAGIDVPAFGTFDVAQEARVVRIDGPSISRAAQTLAAQAPTDALFLSCTNLRTLDVIPELERELGRPVLSSNLVLAWHMMRLAGGAPPPGAPGRLFA